MLDMDRRVSGELLALLQGGGALERVLDFVAEDRTVRDLQLRALPGDALAGRGTASVYVGMSAVLSIHVAGDRVRFETHRSYRERSPIELPWLEWIDAVAMPATAGDVTDFLAWGADAVHSRWIVKEGRVHAALAAPRAGDFVSVNREVSMAFESATVRDAWVASVLDDAVALDGVDRAIVDGRRFGTGLDILGVDRRGRVLAIEAKPAGASSGIATGPLQVWLYAQMLSEWTRQQSEAAEVLAGMGSQRHALGLAEPLPQLAEPLCIVPVLAVGGGRPTSGAVNKARTLGGSLAAGVDSRVDVPELWQLGKEGHVERIEVLR